jgi:hypothetical protein
LEAAGKVLELVVFKLNEEVSREQFLATNDGVSTWALQQPGFISREMSYDAEGDRWIDVVWWASLEDARAAADSAMSSESCLPMFSLIDTESTLMIHAAPVMKPVRADSAVAA